MNNRDRLSIGIISTLKTNLKNKPQHMNTETIGTWAGLIWNALNEAQTVLTTKQIKKITKLKDKELYAAIGWLARENKVEIAPVADDPKELAIALL
jgi:hypothetical protein